MFSTDNVNWTDTDLTTSANAPLPDINSGVTGFLDASGTPRVFYITQPINGIVSVAEAFWNGSAWIWGGNFRHSQPASGTALAGYLFNTSPTVWYIGTDGDIQVVSSDNVFNADATAVSGAPKPWGLSNLLGYKFNSNITIMFFTSDGYVRQIWWNGSRWNWDDVTQLANTFSCDPNRYSSNATNNILVPSGLTGYMFNNQPTVNCYAPSLGHIIQMWWTGSQEKWDDWTQAAGGPGPDLGTPLTGYGLGNSNTVFYRSQSGYLYEYLWNGSTTQDIQVEQILITPVGLASAIF